MNWIEFLIVVPLSEKLDPGALRADCPSSNVL